MRAVRGGTWIALAVGALGALGAGGCEGPAGPAGEPGDPGDPGDPGEPGEPGEDPRTPFLAGAGLVIEVLDTTLIDGTATTTFEVTNDSGYPLDIDGQFTPGTVSINFVLARLAEDSEGVVQGFHAYTTREQTSPITDETAVQPAADSGGTFEELEPGVYTYTFGTTVEPPDASATHRVAIYATRSMDDDTFVANTVFDFIPSGSGEPTTWQVVSEASCNDCHGELAFHGGSRRGLEMCITCHSQNDAIDPDTGNSIDFENMVHKIHMGRDLPSVIAGTPYQIIGFRQSVHDYSTVGFPGFISNCATCHGGPDAEAHRQRPTAQACTSCHDTTVFTTPVPDGMVLHGGGTQPDDAMCAVCHAPTGSIAGVTDVHLPPVLHPDVPPLELTLLDVRNSGPGEAPIVTFRVEVGGSARDILAEPLPGLSAMLAGPNTDFAWRTLAPVQGGGARGTLTAVNAAAGEFDYAFDAQDALPVDAAGSYTVALEGFHNPTHPFDGDDTVEVAAANPVMAFAVTDPEPVPRRMVVDSERCNDCHTRLAFHRSRRLDANYCTTCHNPDMTNEQGAPRVRGVEQLVESVNFGTLIHKIHAGGVLSQGYTLGVRPFPNATNPWGTAKEYSDVRYPRPLAECGACHVSTTYDLPLAMTHMPTLRQVRECTEDPTDPEVDELCDMADLVVIEEILTRPETAACTACHDRPDTQAHAEIMTTTTGAESCATCHGPGSSYAVDRAHGLAP
jgi:OmcA/MtrC family decaheme c-type cytochrome